MICLKLYAQAFFGACEAPPEAVELGVFQQYHYTTGPKLHKNRALPDRLLFRRLGLNQWEHTKN